MSFYLKYELYFLVALPKVNQVQLQYSIIFYHEHNLSLFEDLTDNTILLPSKIHKAPSPPGLPHQPLWSSFWCLGTLCDDEKLLVGEIVVATHPELAFGCIP